MSVAFSNELLGEEPESPENRERLGAVVIDLAQYRQEQVPEYVSRRETQFLDRSKPDRTYGDVRRDFLAFLGTVQP